MPPPAAVSIMRFLARCFLPIFAVWLCLFPAMTYAVTIPTFKVGGQFIPVTGAALDIAVLASRLNPWVATAVTGLTIAKFVIETIVDNTTPGSVNILPSGVSQSTQGGTNWPNLGWVKDANGVWQPPATSATVLNYKIGLYTDVTPQAVCQAMTTGYGFINDGVTSSPDACHYHKSALDTAPMSSAINLLVPTCLAGYTYVAPSCVLSNASQVIYPSDGKPTLTSKADGTGFALDARDPDNLSLSSIPTQITSTGTNNGSPFRTTVSPVTGGGLTVTSELQIQNADGSTSTYKQIATIAPDGKVVDSSAANYPGSLAQQTGSTQALAPSTAPANMPTDYNREATQLQIKNNLDVIKTDLDSAQVPVDVAGTDIAALDAAKAGRDAFKTDIDALSSAASPSPVATLFQPFTPSACQPLSWTYGSANTMGSHVYTLDLCPWVPTIQRVGAWAMYLLTAAMLFQMFTRRPEGGGD